MGIDLNLIQWLKLQLDREKEHCHRKIEFCLIRTFSEIKKWSSREVHLPSNFDQKLMQRLTSLEEEQESLRDKILGQLLYNKRINYAIAGGLAVVLSVVILQNSDYTSVGKDSASVVTGNTRFVDKPSSQNYLTNSEESLFINEVKRNPENILLLEKVERYYQKSGKEQAASEIREIINRAR